MTLRDADSLVDPASGYRLSPETNFDRQEVEVRTAESGAIRPDLVLQRQVQTPVETLTWETVHVCGTSRRARPASGRVGSTP